MPKHEQFEQLCALAAAGELAPEQHRELADHLKWCESCQQSYDEFRLLLAELPAVTDNVEELLAPAAAVQDALKERFLARARAENIHLSPSAGRGRTFAWNLAGPRLGIPLAAAAGVALGVVSLLVVQGEWPRKPVEVVVRSTPPPMPRTETPTAKPENSGAVATAPSRDETEALAEVARLQAVNQQLNERVSAIQAQFDAASGEKERLETLVGQLSAANTASNGEKQQNADLLTKALADLEKAKADRAQWQAALNEQQERAADSSERLRLQTAGIAREREMLSADRDIRDLMGARNLHIIDVHDADGQGKNKPVFGRVFFTEGKSLIFYAFDLDERRLVNAQYTYQAWGERGGEPATIRSLGMFFSDDRNLRRWVMKFDKPEELREIDSVFVTLEPLSEPKKPHGQRLLYAYLSSHINHP